MAFIRVHHGAMHRADHVRRPGMKTVVEETCEQAWLVAAEHLAGSVGHTDYNMVVEIAKPALHNPADIAMRKVVDAFFCEREVNRVSTVADTIFPAAQYLDHGRRG